MLRLLFAAATLCLLATACAKKTTASFTGDDKLMVDGAKQIRLAIEAYHTETSDYPDSIRAAESHLTPGTQWPANPYTQQPIADNGSSEFDPAKSVGTVYYERYSRDDQVVGYRLHVFGKTGRLMIFDNSAFGAQ
jgi:hypothetical protein